MSFFVEVLCTESIDSSACVIVGTDSYRLIFNCGEGVQRLCVEHKVRLGKIAGVLVTDFKPQNCFGLPGLSLTLSDAGNKKVAIAGPPNLHKLITASRHFMKLPDHLLVWSDCAKREDDPVTIVQNNEVMLQQVLINESAPGWGHFSYVGRSPALLGKFDVKKAMSLHVPKGELFGKLKNGHSVTLADGTVVRPEQVLGDAEPCKHFAVVCCVTAKDQALLQALINNAAINRYRAAPEGSGDLHCMVHLSPADTVRLPEYQAWMRSFGPHVAHILCGIGADARGTTHSAYAATALQCSKMHLAVPAMFPALRTAYSHIFPAAADLPTCNNTPELEVHAGIPGMKYNFLPLRSQGLSYANAVLETQEHAGVLWERAKTADNAEAVSTYLEKLHSAQTAAAEAIRSLRGEKAKEDNFPDIPDCENLRIYSAQASLLARCEAHLSFLGTGCAIPSKYRNVSGILLDLPARGTADQEDSALLIDAGESTWAQMLRLAHETENAQGMSSTVPEVSYRLARKIKIVWVSHPHADHHLGLVRVIAERKRALLKSQAGWSELPLEPLVVIAPGSVLAFLREYTALNGYLDGAYVAVSCRAFDPHDDCTYTDSYWNQDLLGAPHAVPEPSSPRSPGRGHHRGGEVKRQRLEEKQHAPAPGIHRSASFSSVGSASPPGEKPLHPVATTSDLKNMAMDTCEVNPADSSTTGGRGWRNFKAVFREEISAEVRELAAVAKAKALAVMYSCGITSLMNVQVVHCGQSYGLCLEFDNGATPRGVIKLVYSGDTRPCDRLVEAGRGATVLIHEATFENDKQAEAVSKRHSTMGEAADVGRRMGAYRVMFTHFSQRYPGVPQLMQATPSSGAREDPDQHVDGDGNASGQKETSPMSPGDAASPSSACAAPVLAFDFMRVALRDLLWAPAATALLAAAYPIGSSNSLDTAAAEVDNED